MVYKKYEKREGKIFGPYYYESYRINGKVKKSYIGGDKEYSDWLDQKKVKKYTNKKEIVVSFLFCMFLIFTVFYAVFFAHFFHYL